LAGGFSCRPATRLAPGRRRRDFSMSKRSFKITMSERCFRFKPDALDSHAPRGPGVFEFVIFDPQVQPIVLFVAATDSIYSSLANHLMGNAKPTADELFK